MEVMRKSWTDDRLDDFRAETQWRFEDVARRFEDVARRFDKVDSEIGQLRVEMNARFDSLQRSMLHFSGALVVALVGLVLTQV